MQMQDKRSKIVLITIMLELMHFAQGSGEVQTKRFPFIPAR